MKIRTDFETNSSSSSFIAVFGTAKNKDIALESANKNKLNEYIVTGKVLLEKWNELYRWNTCNDWCWVDPFQDKNSINEDNLYFIYSDCQDVEANEDGDISEDDLDEHYDSVSSMIDKLEGFEFKIRSGSGRNG